jgi:Fe-S cluster assembly protein SufD
MNIAIPMTAAELALGQKLPHRRLEEWRWSDLRQLIGKAYPPHLAASGKDAARLAKTSPFAKIAKQRIVFVDGALDRKLSQTDGIDFEIGVPAFEGDDEPLLAISAALAKAGVTLRLGGNTATPIELLFMATEGPARAIATRHRIEIAPGADVTLIETYLGAGDYLNNCVVDIVLGEGARLERIKAEIEAPEAVHLAHTRVTLGAQSILRDFTLTSGARLHRQNGTYRFGGEHADARISGSYILGARQHADTRLVVDHAVPHCTSRELFKCVLDGHARGIFQGKVIVQPGAQKTDGKQSSHALLLSETAEFDAKPELEIFADDVVCGHGATAGDLDHDQLFYLESRGIPPKEAKALLVSAFVGEALDSIGSDTIREALTAFAEERLRRPA